MKLMAVISLLFHVNCEISLEEERRRNITNEYGDIGEEERLVIDLFREYNPLIRPVPNATSPPVSVDFGVTLMLLISVDEKNQILHTNVWLTMSWNDFQLQWDPADYDNISRVHIPSDRVWLPDIVLFNNADGNYEVAFKSNTEVKSNGEMTWVPPALFKSSCRIDVEWFPFDEQICTLEFGSWTYNSDELVLNWYKNYQAIDLTEYPGSGIWDIIDVPGYLSNNKETRKSKMVFNLIIRRKTLFYTVILIIPTVLMAFLSMMAFYLPADSAEKISLTVNLLLALVVFLLLVSKILPPTSNIPLVGKYLILALVLNMLTVMVTVVIVNVYFRNALTHSMPPFVKWLFIDMMPKFLMMQRAEKPFPCEKFKPENYSLADTFENCLLMPSAPATIMPFLARMSTKRRESWKQKLSRKLSRKRKKSVTTSVEEQDESAQERLGKTVRKTLDSIDYITKHMHTEMMHNKVRNDWRYVAMVIDRLLLLVFFGATLGGTVGIIMTAPHVFDAVDERSIIKALNAKYQNWTGRR